MIRVLNATLVRGANMKPITCARLETLAFLRCGSGYRYVGGRLGISIGSWVIRLPLYTATAEPWRWFRVLVEPVKDLILHLTTVGTRRHRARRKGGGRRTAAARQLRYLRQHIQCDLHHDSKGWQ